MSRRMKSKNEIEVIYNEKYKKVFQISSGYFDAVYLVENLVNHKKYFKVIQKVQIYMYIINDFIPKII